MGYGFGYKFKNIKIYICIENQRNKRVDDSYGEFNNFNFTVFLIYIIYIISVMYVPNI